MSDATLQPLPPPAAPEAPVTVRTVFRTWWPLATSWLLMGLELPLVSAVVARLAEPTLSLAAYGAAVFPLALLIESPIIMLLSASTALSKDWASYRLVRTFMYVAASALTALHVLIAFTPLYDVVIGDLMGIPVEVRVHARVGLQIMTPWTFAIAYRRFQQGVLIRFGHTRSVGAGTAIRLLCNALVLAIGYTQGTATGIVVGTLAVAAGVVGEAVYIGLRVHPVLRDKLRPAPPLATPLTPSRFARFYVPLSLTPMLMLVGMPILAAAMSRMPVAIGSLAVWPVIMGLVFTLRSVGFALNEVVVSLLERPDALPALRAFSKRLALTASALLLLLAATPLGHLWFGRVSGLHDDLVALAHPALFVAFMMPALAALQSLHQGTLVHAHRTRGVTEAVVLYLLTVAVVLALGLLLDRVAGVYVALAGMLAGNSVQFLWLRHRARGVVDRLAAPAGTPATVPVATD